MIFDEKIAMAQRRVESGRRIVERLLAARLEREPPWTFSNSSTVRKRFSNRTWPTCSDVPVLVERDVSNSAGGGSWQSA